jgi:hypothetical protein
MIDVEKLKEALVHSIFGRYNEAAQLIVASRAPAVGLRVEDIREAILRVESQELQEGHDFLPHPDWRPNTGSGCCCK